MAPNKILMGCTNYWTSPFQVGSHHIARQFSDSGWSVGFLSDPISPLHILNGVDQGLRDRWNLYRKSDTLGSSDEFWAYVPGSIATPNNKILLRSYWVQKNWHRLSFPYVISKLKQHGFYSVDVLYLDSPNHLYLLDLIKYKKSIFRIADKSSGFSKSTHAARDAERMIADRVDVVLYTARNLEKHVASLAPKKAVYFPNGVNYRYFAGGKKLLPPEFEYIKRPIALYVGSMEDWFDFDLINFAAKKLPHVSFVFIGSDTIAKLHLESLKNIHLLGTRKYFDLPSYMHNADVGLIPFDVKNYADLVNSINPLKLYEYMACGLAVVSVDWQELRLLQSPAILCKTQNDFVAAIIDACSGKTANREYLQMYASQHDWAAKVEVLKCFIEE